MDRILQSVSADAANDETREASEPMFRLVGGRFQLTTAGMDRYRERFARAGFNIENIRTIDAFEEAVRASYRAEEAALNSALLKKYADELEARLLRAIARGNDAERQRVTELLQRRRHLGLKSVT